MPKDVPKTSLFWTKGLQTQEEALHTACSDSNAEMPLMMMAKPGRHQETQCSEEKKHVTQSKVGSPESAQKFHGKQMFQKVTFA